MTANALGLLGLARRAGKLDIGEEPVEAACRSHRAYLVLLAADAAENTVRRARRLAQNAGTACQVIPFSKEEVGMALGRKTCAVLAVTDGGLAQAFLDKLKGSEKPEAQEI